MDYTLYQILKVILSVLYHETLTNKNWLKIHINKIKKKIKIETGYYPELLRPKTMKLLGSISDKVTKDTNKNSEKVYHLEITEVILVHCSILIINKIQECCFYMFQINHSVNY